MLLPAPVFPRRTSLQRYSINIHVSSQSDFRMLTLDKQHTFTDSEMRPYAWLLGHFNLHSYHTFAHLQSRATLFCLHFTVFLAINDFMGTSSKFSLIWLKCSMCKRSIVTFRYRGTAIQANVERIQLPYLQTMDYGKIT